MCVKWFDLLAVHHELMHGSVALFVCNMYSITDTDHAVAGGVISEKILTAVPDCRPSE